MSVMSDDEDLIIAPWIGPMSCKKCLSVMVISFNEEVIENISAALSAIHSKGSYSWKLVILRAPHLMKVVNQISVTGNVGIDFIILAMDTSQVSCIEWAKSVYSQIHPDLRIRRVVLVNAYGVTSHMAVGAEDLLSLQNELNLDLLSANTTTSDGATSLAQRLLKYLDVSFGTNTGIPNLNI